MSFSPKLPVRITQENALKAIGAIEGEWSNHPADTGGLTRWGITLKFLQAHNFDINGDGVIDARDLNDLTQEKAHELMLQVFWQPWMDDAPSELAIAVFDFAVNASIGMAEVILQRALKETGWYQGKIDGVIGPKTQAALAQIDSEETLRVWIEFVKQRALYYARIVEAKPSQAVFIEGWIRRAFT